jgi:hypothetical protein
MILTMTVIMIEIDFEITSYLITYAFISIGLFLLLKRKSFYGLTPKVIFVILFTSLIPTWILSTLIIMEETNVAYSKIKSIPKEKLVEFYNTNDINIIPEHARRTWIGIRYQKIDIVSENRIRNIRAVGWRGSSVFGYYDIDEDNYSGSYH